MNNDFKLSVFNTQSIRLLIIIAVLPMFFEAFALAQSASPAFSDQTHDAGINVRFRANGYANFDYTGGGAVGDFNNDGWQDLFAPSGGADNVPDLLYINNGDGTFTDRAQEWGLTAIHKGKGACCRRL